MQLKAQIQNDLKAAMKSRDNLRTMTLRGVLTAVTLLEKDLRREANQDEILQVIKRERARRDETLEFARKAGRQDLVEQNETEAGILDSYLPAALTADELAAAIDEQLSAGASQMGPVMKALRERYGARLDGKLASEMVRQALAAKSG